MLFQFAYKQVLTQLAALGCFCLFSQLFFALWLHSNGTSKDLPSFIQIQLQVKVTLLT